MAKKRKQNIRKTRKGKDISKKLAKANKINAATRVETCDESLSPFGGLLTVVKFLEVVQFQEIFEALYTKPSRDPKNGHYFMVKGILMLLFIGFNRLWHFFYIRFDPLICGIFNVVCLPVASTYWRYLDSMGINQAKSLLNLISVLRRRVWEVCGFVYKKVHISIDTTVETVYGDQQGARKGHNPRQRGKKGYRPVLAFIDETREYLSGKLRKGETLSGEETAKFLKKIRLQLPDCVRHVLVRADGEFCSWEAVEAALEERLDFIFANKSCKPSFDPGGWYQPPGSAGISSLTVAFTSRWVGEKRFGLWRCGFLLKRPSRPENRFRGCCLNMVDTSEARFQGIKANAIRIARLKLLFVAAKVIKDAVKYSLYDSRTPALLAFYGFLDELRKKPRPWETVAV